MTFALLACIVSAAFAVVVFSRFVRSHRPAFASWALGLCIFSAAAGFQAAGEAHGFSTFTFRGFYLLGGVLGVAYLALGTVFLNAPRRVAWPVAGVLALATLVCAIDAAVIPVDAAKLSTPSGVLGQAIEQGTLLYVAVVVMNILGTLVLVGGSAWSAWRCWRGHAPVDRVVCNVLLTSGALVIAAGFSAAKLVTSAVVGGGLEPLGVYELIGISVMFVGFLSLGRVGHRTPQLATLRPANRTQEHT